MYDVCVGLMGEKVGKATGVFWYVKLLGTSSGILAKLSTCFN